MPATADRRRSLPMVPLLIGGAVILLALVAIVVSSLGGDDEGGADGTVAENVEQTRPVEVRGDPLPPLTDPSSDPAIGEVAPELIGQSFDGSPVEIVHDGTPKLIFFVAHWCPHCQAEVPVVTSWLDGSSSKEGVDVYAVSTSVDPAAPNYPPSEWLSEEGWPAPVLADDSSSTAATAYGLSAFPFFTMVDGDGTVLFRGSGELQPSQLDQLVALASGSEAAAG